MSNASETTGRKRVLVLGATGMLGHRLWREASGRFDATATIRAASIPASAAGVLDPQRTITGVAAEDEDALERALIDSRPDAVVNCIGMVKQRPEASDPVALVAANSLFPHLAEAACARHGARLIHLSTDCVFSGSDGGYTEEDRPDPADLYGRSKLAGEPEGEGTLTLRTSMIGRELDRSSGLLEWILGESGTVRGFPNAIFTGPTTPVLSRLICDLIDDQPDLGGLFHVAAEPISKLELLRKTDAAFATGLEIEPDPSVEVDRSLVAAKLTEATGWRAPVWDAMINELAEEGSGDADR